MHLLAGSDEPAARIHTQHHRLDPVVVDRRIHVAAHHRGAVPVDHPLHGNDGDRLLRVAALVHLPPQPVAGPGQHRGHRPVVADRHEERRHADHADRLAQDPEDPAAARLGAARGGVAVNRRWRGRLKHLLGLDRLRAVRRLVAR
jgi:hypothetical protein